MYISSTTKPHINNFFNSFVLIFYFLFFLFNISWTYASNVKTKLKRWGLKAGPVRHQCHLPTLLFSQLLASKIAKCRYKLLSFSLSVSLSISLVDKDKSWAKKLSSFLICCYLFSFFNISIILSSKQNCKILFILDKFICFCLSSPISIDKVYTFSISSLWYRKGFV